MSENKKIYSRIENPEETCPACGFQNGDSNKLFIRGLDEEIDEIDMDCSFECPKCGVRFHVLYQREWRYQVSFYTLSDYQKKKAEVEMYLGIDFEAFSATCALLGTSPSEVEKLIAKAKKEKENIEYSKRIGLI